MLPGFNHNIRYKDRVFHVQTEDNGLSQPRLITQVFVDGHILAIEKSTYEDILSAAESDEQRDQQIRVKMQAQHKMLLKNLVAGSYDDKITLYLGGAETVLPHHEDVPAAAIQEAEALPMAPMDPYGLSQDLEAIIIEAPEEISPESLLDPDFLEEIGAAVEEETRRDALARPPTPIHSLVDDLSITRSTPKADFLAVLDEEMKKQLPFEPSDTEDADEPAPLPEDEQITQRPQPAARPRGGASEGDVAFTKRRPLRPTPDPRDTLVDFGLPAALRDTLERSGKKPAPPAPKSANDLIDAELANAEEKLSPVKNMRIGDQTMLETDATELRRRIEAQRDRLRAKKKAKDEENIVVTERSLDEVILSYLSDDPEN